VLKINLDKSGKRATGVTYVDASDQEWEQPAELVLLCAFQLFNIHMLLVSGIGKPYDPGRGDGVIGRNFSHQVTSDVNAFFDGKNFNPFIASGAIGMCIDEFNGDNFDHSALACWQLQRGAVQTGARPIVTTMTPPGLRWGMAWKTAGPKTISAATRRSPMAAATHIATCIATSIRLTGTVWAAG
jgi:gluconate 2-dehydrogenase alpha chain